MAATNWEQKKKNALDLVQRLLDIWQGRTGTVYDIKEIGPRTNNAVLMLGLDTGLPLPYREDKMAPNSIPVISEYFKPIDRGREPDDEVAKNIKAWIRLIEKAEYVPVEQEIPPVHSTAPVSDPATIKHDPRNPGKNA